MMQETGSRSDGLLIVLQIIESKRIQGGWYG